MTVQKESRLKKILLSPLSLLSFFYGLAVSTRINFFSRGIFRIHSLNCKVISVGNISVGGTGKTPFVVLLAEMIRAKGFKVAVLSRGYRGKYQKLWQVVSDAQKILMDIRQAGDEPYLLATRLPGIPVIVGKNRWQAGQYAIDSFRSEVLILDDGFQHLPLNRDLNFLLLDSSCPFGNGHLLPRGNLREPLKEIRRAEAIILTKANQTANIFKLNEKIKDSAEGIPLFQVAYAPEKIFELATKTSFSPEYMSGKKVFAFCGIASPESFRQTLLELKANITRLEIFSDHHWYKPKELVKIVAQAKNLGAEALVTTEKDWMRLQGFSPGTIPLWVLTIHHVFPENDQIRFEKLLFSRLGLAK